jgi:hypothetical protein
MSHLQFDCTMKLTLFVFAAVLSIVLALPIDDEKPKPEVITNEYVNNGDKGYNFK